MKHEFFVVVVLMYLYFLSNWFTVILLTGLGNYLDVMFNFCLVYFTEFPHGSSMVQTNPIGGGVYPLFDHIAH